MAGGKVELNIGVLMGKRLGLVGTVLRARPIEEKLVLAQRFAAELLPLFDTGALRPVVDSRFPLEQVADAHRHMEANENVGKIILDVRS
jgi:NADPH:quinone reductase-like Zn-dependent oxidoreductase